MDFNETWQEARPQCLQPSLYFLGHSENRDSHPGIWLAENFSSETAERNSTNLTGSKISMSSTKFCVFWAYRKTKMAVLFDCLQRWHIFSGAWYMALWTPCYGFLRLDHFLVQFSSNLQLNHDILGASLEREQQSFLLRPKCTASIKIVEDNTKHMPLNNRHKI